MPQQIASSVENNFTKGLITESTGLNFPENAATDTDNCDYTLIGDVTRRLGINYEENYQTNLFNRTNSAVSSYKWNNAGGDGETQIVVEQIAGLLSFYRSSSSTEDNPLSAQLLPSTVNISNFTTIGNTFDPTLECQFTDGNGYLFVFHPSCEPFYCTYTPALISSAAISVKIRDFTGTTDNLSSDTRPLTLSVEHLYNLTNQGWKQSLPYNFTSSTFNVIGTGSKSFTVNVHSDSVILGDVVNILNANDDTVNGVYHKSGTVIMTGTVTGNVGTVLTVNVFYVDPSWTGANFSPWVIVAANQGYVDTWRAAVGNYPSNSDVWWYFKDQTDTFNPAITLNKVTSGGPAPKGHFILDAFNQQRSIASGAIGLTAVSTLKRPRTGCWFQGRIWYTGVDDSFQASGDQPFQTWTENVYFSQVIEKAEQFGNCYQLNDPTSETLFDILPTDGGVISIQGAGSIYKLFPIANGLLVFAGNGIWFITGSQGIGFTANDYTVTKISSVRSISGTSFVNVLGLPYFWNEDGIYSVSQTQSGSLTAESITVGSIASFYEEIPLSCKKYARGDYDPINFVIRWIYRDEDHLNVTDRYSFNKILNFNTYNKAFYPYTIDTDSASINSILYVTGPGGSAMALPAFKYLSSSFLPNQGTYKITFAEEYDESYLDWSSETASDYVSYFITGYKLHGQGSRKFQPQYIQVYNRQNGAPSSYKIQGIWDYADSPESGRWSSVQVVLNALSRFGTVFRRHKIRGHGYVLQFKIQSVTGMPFDIQGWAVVDTVNQGT